MPAGLLDSQFADLEPPGPDERSITVDIGGAPGTEADEIVRRLELDPTAGRPR
jgi:gluconokinase